MEENKTLRSFEGKSSHNDINEALDNAFEAAKDGLRSTMIEWTLSKISGVWGGFVPAKDMTVTIEARPFQGASDVAERSTTGSETAQNSESGQVQVPVFISGLVSKITGVDICLDGATHRLETILGTARLKAGNEEAQKFLDEVSGSRQRVAVAGYPVWSPECIYIRVYHAAPAEQLAAQIGVKF